MRNDARPRLGDLGWEMEMKEIIQKSRAEVLAEHKRRHADLSESLMIADGARQMADLVVSGVQQMLANPPVSAVKPAQARQFPSGLSPERIARLRQIAEGGARHVAESDATMTVQRRRNIENRAQKFFENTGVYPATATAFIEATKREAGW